LNKGNALKDLFSQFVSSKIFSAIVMIFPISALVSALDSHINPDSEAGGLIWADMENFKS
jgi:hypothetical protein